MLIFYTPEDVIILPKNAALRILNSTPYKYEIFCVRTPQFMTQTRRWRLTLCNFYCVTEESGKESENGQ